MGAGTIQSCCLEDDDFLSIISFHLRINDFLERVPTNTSLLQPILRQSDEDRSPVRPS